MCSVPRVVKPHVAIANYNLAIGDHTENARLCDDPQWQLWMTHVEVEGALPERRLRTVRSRRTETCVVLGFVQEIADHNDVILVEPVMVHFLAYSL